jgi:hypothetical protein
MMGVAAQRAQNGEKFFWFFFFKKRTACLLLLRAMRDCGAGLGGRAGDGDV